MAGPARQFHTQQVHYLRKTVNYNDTGVASGVAIGTVPAGARIMDIVVVVDTAFNAATTNVLTLGTTATGTDIASSSDTASGTAGAKRITTGLPVTFSADTVLYARYTQTGTAASAGSAVLMVSYLPNNDL